MNAQLQPLPQEIDHVLACSLIASGLRLKDVARQFGVTISEVWNVLNHPDHKDAYARAREIKAHGLAEEIGETADKVEQGDVAPDAGRVMLDAKKWLASRLDQRRWGDKLTTDVNVTITVDKLAERLTSGRVQARIAEDVEDSRITGNMLTSSDSTTSEVRQPVTIDHQSVQNCTKHAPGQK